MRILALVTDAFGGYGGIAQYNRDLIAAMSAIPATEAVLVVPRSGEKLHKMPQKVALAEARFQRFLYAVSALVLAFRFRPTLVLCAHLYMVPFAYLLSRLIRVPLWLQLHGIEAWDRPGFLIRVAAERADLVTVVSRYTRRRFMSWAVNAPESVRILPNTFSAISGRTGGGAVWSEFAGRRILLTVSRIAPHDNYKGHDRILSVLPEIRRSIPDVLYAIAGEGADRARLQRVVKEQGLADAVCFVGRVPNDRLDGLYRAADVFAMPSTKEGFGIVFLEAAARELPVVGGNKDGSLDALADGKIGAAIDPNDPAELIAAILSAFRRKREPNPHVQRFNCENFTRHLGGILDSAGLGA